MHRFVTTLVAFLVLGCASPSVRVALEHDGERRNYWLSAPEGLDGPAPLVLALHGGGPAGANKGRGMGRLTTLHDLAHDEGFIAAFPSSLAGNWNDGRDLQVGYVEPDTDDVGFIEAVIDDIALQLPVDPARVYVTGVSNGGFMTQRLLCERPDRFAASVTYIATMPATLSCTPSLQTPVMFVLGTEDPLVPYEGGPVADGDRGEAISADDAMAFWAEHNGCGPTPDVTELPDVDPDDGTTARMETWPDCDADVARLVLDGAGHTWPSGPRVLEGFVGPTSGDVDGADVFWSFVRDRTR
ncbi:MAG: prolyl oligopeptidase family serine peptidase [Myxococcales bacterium]|nr:prolyl oligopeptidase family serine peptidase [Myxococcales bacterium]